MSNKPLCFSKYTSNPKSVELACAATASGIGSLAALDEQSMKAWEQGVMERMQRMHTDEAFRLKIARNLS